MNYCKFLLNLQTRWEAGVEDRERNLPFGAEEGPALRVGQNYVGIAVSKSEEGGGKSVGAVTVKKGTK